MVPEEPRRVRKRCPAIILAVKRMARIKSRMINLIDSIITINGISIKGIHSGIR